jgi:hypothetical protein
MCCKRFLKDIGIKSLLLDATVFESARHGLPELPRRRYGLGSAVTTSLNSARPVALQWVVFAFGVRRSKLREGAGVASVANTTASVG